jgi:hypothetical protein
MTELRVEKAADEVIAADSALAASAARAGKPRSGIIFVPPVTSRSAPGPSRTVIIIGTIVAIIGGTLLGIGFLGGTGPTVTPTPSRVAAATPTAAGVVTPQPTAQVSTPAPPTTPTSAPTPTPTPSPVPTPSLPVVVVSLIDYITVLGVEPSTSGPLMEGAATDGSDDWFVPVGGQPVIEPGIADIRRSLTFEAEISQGFIDRLPDACGQDGLVCDPTPPVPGSYYVYIVEVAEPVEPEQGSFLEAGIAYLDETPLDGSIPDPYDGGPRDFFRAMNTIYAMRLPPPGTPPSLVRLAFTRGQETFQAEPTTSFAYSRGNVIGVFIAETEWDGASVFRLFTFYVAEARGIVSDTWPDIEEESERVPDSVPLIALD